MIGTAHSWLPRRFKRHWGNIRQPAAKSHKPTMQPRDYQAFDGQLWLEVFLLSGINAMPGDVEKIACLSRELRPDRIHLNTIVRPPAEDFAAAVAMAQLEELAELFDPPASIAAGFNTTRSKRVKADDFRILSMLQRRPCTINQIVAAFDMHINEVSKSLGHLMRHNRIRADLRNREIYYSSQ